MLDGFQQDRENLSVHEVHGGHEEQHRDVPSGCHGGMYRTGGHGRRRHRRDLFSWQGFIIDERPRTMIVPSAGSVLRSH